MTANDALRITACPDGPLLVRGPVELVDEQGETIDPMRRTVALCRCGASAIRPFCDGTHKRIGFRTMPPPRTSAIRFDDDEGESESRPGLQPS